MKKDLNDFESIEQAVSFFVYLIENGYTIDYILDNKNIFLIYLTELLFRSHSDNKKVMEAISNYYKKYTINEDKTIVITDTHIGSIYEYMNYMYIVYEYAYKNNIKNIIHCGDMVQGLTHFENIRLSFAEQKNSLNNFYKNVVGINTYFLMGNHEYNLKFDFPNNFDSLFNDIPNVTNVGYQNAYIYFNDDKPINIYHYIPYRDVRADVYTLDSHVVIEGHSHQYSNNNNNNRISVPALCKINKPAGFLELSNEGDLYLSKLMMFDENDIFNQRDEQRILKRY